MEVVSVVNREGTHFTLTRDPQQTILLLKLRGVHGARVIRVAELYKIARAQEQLDTFRQCLQLI